MLTRLAVAALFPLASLSAVPTTARAQQRDSLAPHAAPIVTAVFRGRVVHAGTSAPVSGADVWLVVPNLHASTDSSGAFRFDDVTSGMELVQVRYLGLVVQRDTIVLSAEHENVRTYALAEVATLDTVRTIAGARKYISPRLQGFEERRLSGMGGHFISDSVMRRNENTTMANLVESRMPGLTQQTVTVPGKIITALVSTRKPCSGLAILGACTAPNCFVAVYLDGVLQYSSKMGGVAPPDFRTDYNISDYAGAEFYAGGAASPMGMHSDDNGCGSLWLWTRER